MSLKLWIPLNGNTNNYGLSGAIAFTERGESGYDDGKIGRCKKFGGSDSLIADYRFELPEEGSLCMWAYWDNFPSSSSNDWLVDFADRSGYANAVLALSIYHGTKISVCLGGRYDASVDTHDYSSNGTFMTGKWYHLCIIWDSIGCTLYIDGIRYHEYTTLSERLLTTASKFSIGSNVMNSTTRLKGKLNDIRLYDHCISERELHEICCALVRHYKFDYSFGNMLKGTNLVRNGWGGTGNWTKTDSTSVSTSVPSSPSGITHAYSNGNETKEFIPLDPSHTYKFSAYIKKNTGSTCYLSLIPYDIDKKQIYNYEQPDGFKSATLTTIKEPLNPGDTVIYLADDTDMSKWVSTSINTRYACYVALFGYADSTGYIYPDLYYTRRIYSYRGTTSGVDVTTNIDVTNKTVTLLSPYSGTMTIPAGTSICLSAAGSGYYYPNTISGTNAADWVLVSKTFIPKNVNYLKAARYVKVVSLSTNQWLAGITLLDMTETNEVEFDCSGHMIDWNNLTGDFEKTDKNNAYIREYNQNIRFGIGAASPRHHGSLESFRSGDLLVAMPKLQEFTMSFWIKRNSQNVEDTIFTPLYPDANINFVYGMHICFNDGNHLEFRQFIKPISSQANYSVLVSNAAIDNQWHFIEISRNNTKATIFIDGNEDSNIVYSESTISYEPILNALDGDIVITGYDYVLFLEKQNYECYGFNGCISDFRIYANNMSLYRDLGYVHNKLLELHDTGAYIDNEGNFYTNDLDEINENLLKYEYTIIGTNTSNTSTRGKYIKRNGVWAMAFKATDTYWSSAYRHVMLAGRFKENTQYVFDLWLDTDDVVYNGNNVAGGFTIYYTDNTTSGSSLRCTGSQTEPKGWQHKFYISTVGKTVSDVIVYYNISATFYVRADSFIAPIYEAKITSNGISYTNQFIENTDVASIGKAAVNGNSFIEV